MSLYRSTSCRLV